MGSIAFVHGTGVREPGYSSTVKLIRRKLQSAVPGVEVKECYWGGEHGAQLWQEGDSIPGYATARAVGATLQEDEEDALWSLLYEDPLFELRLLAESERSSGEVAPGKTPPWRDLQNRLARFQSSDDLKSILEHTALEQVWTSAYGSVAMSAECQEAIKTAGLNAERQRKAIARALVAAAVQQGEQAGIPALDGASRTRMVEVVIDGLGGGVRAATDWLTRPVLGIALRIGTWKINRKKRTFSDSTYPIPGDILLYQTRGDKIREFIKRTLFAIPEPVAVLAHSLGGIACMDLLALDEAARARVSRLITIGSQAPFFYEIDCLTSRHYGEALPDPFVKWLNIWDPRDFLSYVGEKIFPNKVKDFRVDNGQPFPHSHSAYFQNDRVWREVGEFLR